jgi:hypothetical protein
VGDRPGHEFHGNQYHTSGHGSAAHQSAHDEHVHLDEKTVALLRQHYFDRASPSWKAQLLAAQHENALREEKKRG